MSSPAIPDNSHQWLPDAQVLRDLRWCLQAPALVGGLPRPVHDALQAMDRLPTPGPVAAQGRLGPYYEQLWQLLLCQGLGHQLVAHDRQLYDGGQTLGAPDLITYDARQQRYWHLELAAKFYLCNDTGEHQQHWLGPDSNDRLDRKCSHLLNHQLPLIRQPLASAQIDQWAAELGLPPTKDRLTSACLMQGWLFLPWQKPAPAPAILQGQTPGLWARWQDWPALAQQHRHAHEQWILLPRRYWLAAYDSAGTDNSLPALPLPAAPARQYPALLALCSQHDGHWRERLRVMLVSDRWPDKPDHRATGNRC